MEPITLRADDVINRHITGKVNDSYVMPLLLFRKCSLTRILYFTLDVVVLHGVCFRSAGMLSKITHWGGIMSPLFGSVWKNEAGVMKGFVTAVLCGPAGSVQWLFTAFQLKKCIIQKVKLLTELRRAWVNFNFIALTCSRSRLTDFFFFFSLRKPHFSRWGFDRQMAAKYWQSVKNRLLCAAPGAGVPQSLHTN